VKAFLQCTKKNTARCGFAVPVKSNPRKSTITERPPLESQFPDPERNELKLINKLRNLFKCPSSFYQKFFGFSAASVQSIIPKVTGVYLNIYSWSLWLTSTDYWPSCSEYCMSNLDVVYFPMKLLRKCQCSLHHILPQCVYLQVNVYNTRQAN